MKKIGRLVSAGVKFLREVRTEMKKVQWPGRRETGIFTAVVVASVVVVAVAVWLVDVGLSFLVGSLLR